MAENLDIIIRATDQTAGAFSTITGKVGDLGNKAAGVASKGFSGLQSAVGTGLKAAAGLGIGALVGLGVAFRDSVGLAKIQIDAEKQLAAVLKSTGEAAGLNAKELKDMASSLQNVTNFGDEAIIGGESLLLTFTGIGKDVFPAATETMLDMSQALGQDLKSSAIQLGKALNDPVAGVSALSRVGVSFTEQQKEQIKAMTEAGDVAGAQKLILAELGKEFGGSARAMADPLTQLSNSWGDLKEVVGGLVIPIFNNLAQTVMPVINTVIGEFSRGMEATGSIVGGVMEVLDNFLPEEMLDRIWNVVDAFGEFFQAAGDYGVFAGLMEVLDNFLPDEVIEQIWQLADSFSGLVEQISSKFNLSDIFIALGVVLATIIIPAIAGLIATITPVILVFAAIVTAVMLLRKAWETNFLGIREFVAEAMTKIQAIIKLVLDKVKALWDGNGKETSALIRGIWQYIQDAIKFAMDTILSILDIAMAVLSGDWQAAWDGVLSIVSGVWELLKSLWSNVLSNLWALIKNVDWGGLGSSIIHGIAAGISAAAGAIGSALLGAVTSAWQSAKNFLGINSPSKLFAEMGRQTMTGMAAGITGASYMPANAAVGAMSNTYTNAYHFNINGAQSPMTVASEVGKVLDTRRRRGM